MTSPLVASGTYPCKGYLKSADDPTMAPITSWSAGGTYNYTVAGSATHGGGSCQLSMSYDNGQSWAVIFSYIGGCMVEGATTEFTLPADAPSGEAIFSWSWFNQLGNREMYQNCAVVTITNGGSGLSPSVYPTPFVANADVNSCSTVEGTDIVFPEPGPNVKYGGKYAGGNAQPGTGITGSNCYGPGAQGGSTSPDTGAGSGSGSAPSASASASAAASSSSAWAEPSAASSAAASWEQSSAASAQPTQSHPAGPYGPGSGSVPSAIPSDVSSIGNGHAAQPTSSAAGASSTGKCRRRKRAVPVMHGVEARHARLIRRHMYEEVERREAALKAEHLVHTNASHSHSRRMYEGAELSARAASGRVAALKAEHIVQV